MPQLFYLLFKNYCSDKLFKTIDPHQNLERIYLLCYFKVPIKMNLRK